MTKVGMWEPRKGLSADNIAAAVDDSLRRLRTDYIDVYFAHLDDAEVPLAETLGAFGKLVEAGKVRALGASNHEAARLREALAVSKAQGLPRYEVIQPQYNLYDRSFESTLAGVAQEHGLGVVSYFSLASGFLTGKYRSVEDLKGTAREGFLQGYFDARGLKLLDALRKVADELGATPAQVSLAWLMSRPALTAPIASATSLEQLDDIMAAAELSLPADAVDKLEAASR
jgi:aryl-alcohol dehydrogenase-like predicted oxidoreductase